jgi:hypothetical protein
MTAGVLGNATFDANGIEVACGSSGRNRALQRPLLGQPS